jgi:hypothetical protein
MTGKANYKSIIRWADRTPAAEQGKRSHCTRVRQLPRQVLRTLSRPLQLTPAPFGQLPVAAAGAASTRCLLFVRHLPVAGSFI